jgi:iron(III) transport system permease protein
MMSASLRQTRSTGRLYPIKANFFALLAILVLAVGICYPLWTLLIKSLTDSHGEYVGLLNFITYFSSQGLLHTLTNTLSIGLIVTLITLTLAFTLAYGITHSRFFGRFLCGKLSLLVLFVPSIFPALGLIYLFGNQGPLKDLLGEISLYGPFGIIIGSIIYTLPHAVLLLTVTLRDIDQNLYQAAKTLGAGSWRRFFTITLPNARYGITSAGIVVFIMTITDFGVPKVLGGDYSMLATEIFKQVIGMQNFSMGATVSIILLVPTILAFLLDNWAKKKQKATPQTKPFLESSPVKNVLFTLICWSILLLPTMAIAMVIVGSMINFWPYDLTFTLYNYSFEDGIYGIEPYWNSLILAISVALIGTLFIFIAAYVTERCRVSPLLKQCYKILTLLPLSIPGTVLGLSFILAFNQSWGGFYDLYGGMAILVFNTVIHFYTVCHLTLSGSLARLNPDYEKVGATLGVSGYKTFNRVILPLQANALIDIAFYLFINALTTISAVIFIYSADSILASIAILQMFDSGKISEASAMGTLILVTALAVQFILAAVRYCFSRRAKTR